MPRQRKPSSFRRRNKKRGRNIAMRRLTHVSMGTDEPTVIWVEPHQLCFSQRNISPCFRREGKLVDCFTNCPMDYPGAGLPPIRAIPVRGHLYSLDNRRLLLFKLLERAYGHMAPVIICTIVFDETDRHKKRAIVARWLDGLARRGGPTIAVGRRCCCGKRHGFTSLAMLNFILCPNDRPFIKMTGSRPKCPGGDTLAVARWAYQWTLNIINDY